jgi:tRNA (guanine37-N1)-methyltransferase
MFIRRRIGALCQFVRLIPGVLSDETSALTDSFQDENIVGTYIYQTRGLQWMESSKLLTSGNFEIDKIWREHGL